MSQLWHFLQADGRYGSPSASDIKDSFQRRYAASRYAIPENGADGSIPRLTSENVFRDEYIFAITAKEGSGIAVAPAGKVKISNRISSTEGYLGKYTHHSATNCRQHRPLPRDVVGGRRHDTTKGENMDTPNPVRV